MIKNCIISGNSALGGAGGISLYGGGFIELVNCSIIGNKTEGIYSDSGGGLYCGGGPRYPATATLRNCILWDNQAPEGQSIYLGNWGVANVSYCDIEGGQSSIRVGGVSELNWGLGNIGIDPCFVESGYWDVNSTPNDVNDDLWFDGDYHLLEDSSCIDTGDPNYVAEPNEIDLDGNPRIVNDVIDIGAYEVQPPDPVDLLLGLTDYISELNLHHGIANSLSAKLGTALQLLEDTNQNNDAAAINLLEAFINVVEAQHGKKIPQADADALIATAQEIIEMLNG